MKSSHVKTIAGKTIIITGGTGSFGNSVVEKLLDCRPKKIVIFSRDEKKQFDMRNKYDNPLLKFVIGDVRDEDSIRNAMEGADYVFHAAALKQVPTCEFFPMEAIRTNILGASNVINSALHHKIKKVVVLSTDKAVYPINVMGLTKALMEKIMIAQVKRNVTNSDHKTALCAVRYGNVLYTRGSVLPYFVDLVKQNKSLIITNPDMTRFLLPLSMSVDLVLFALEKGENGFIYVRKSPACTIKTLAEAVCKIFNHKKRIIEVGIRAGEKMHETLVTKEEMLRTKTFFDYYMIPSESQGLDYNKYFYQGVKKNIKDVAPFTSENTSILDLSDTINLLLRLPEIKQELRLLKRQ